MANTVIALKKSATPTAAPTNLANGELAINYADGILYYKAANGTIASIQSLEGNAFGTVNANGTLLVSDTVGDFLTMVSGNNISIIGDAVNDKLTIKLTDDIQIPGLGSLLINGPGGDEGGEIHLANAVTNSVLNGYVVVDIFQNKLRFFETGSPNRGAFINLAAASVGVGTDLLAASGGTDIPARLVANAAFLHANAAFDKANAALTNVSGASFNGNLTVSQNLTSDRIFTLNNGNGENLKVGDDVWIGDTNLANALRIKGQQNASIGYVMFGTNDGKLLGRAGTGPLTYDGNTVWHSGNDGLGSGLDADLLDGQSGSYYGIASDVTAVFARANIAFANANTVMISAQSAFTQANIAYAHANTAHASANAGQATGNAAFVQANTATALATAAQSIANLAFIHANNAYATVNSAFAKANAALPNTSGVTFNGNLNVSQNVSADKFIATNNGNGENFRVGDDVWIGDYNVSNSIKIKGVQNSQIAYISFGTGDNKALGRDGTGHLTYDSNIVWHQGNDGSGSGLDADLLDGQNGTYYGRADDVSAAFALGNNAFARANTANITADRAWNHANAAFATINSAFGVANTAVQNTASVTFVGNVPTLTNARLIGDTSFNGSADIVPSRITFKDTRSLDFPPITSANNGIGLHLKTNTTDGLNDGGTYHGILHLQQWSDISGGLPHQLGFTDNGNVYLRTAINASAWGSWREMWHDANDGAGSNLDADLLDGQQGTYYGIATDVTAANRVANAAFLHANASYIFANSAHAIANLAFAHANAAFLVANTSGTEAEAAFLRANLAHASSNAGLLQANTARNHANAAFAKANTGTPAVISLDTRNVTNYIVFEDSTSGTFANANVSTSLTYNPSTGTLSSTLFNSTSDINKKENIITISDALSIVQEIRGVRFTWKNNGDPSVGVIAQEVEKVLPEVVAEDKSVNYNGIIGVLIEAVKELKMEIETLKYKYNKVEE